MLIEDQGEVMDFLADPRSHGSSAPVDVIETHISEIFLTAETAYKLKRAVHLPYADFSTPEIRLAACQKELALNQTTTPELYVRVRRITRDSGGLAFDGPGEMVDAVVEMRRFGQDDLLDHMARRSALTAPLICELADEIARAHEAAEVISGEGGAENISAVLDINRAGFFEGNVFDAREIESIDHAFREALARCAPLLDARARDSCVRRCHGDLHLNNVCMFQGRPRLFDCIDFNDRLATVDVLYDLAFLVMDLWHRDLKFLANLVTNHYLDTSGREDGFALMPFFTALRAAVRAHVTATQADGRTEANAARLRASAREFYDLALAILRMRPIRLVAVGGLSGSGKSTMATALAPEVGAPPGARLIESDRVRKAMFGVEATTRLPAHAYTPDVSDRVYDVLSDRSRTLLRSGGCVVVDAVYDRPERRRAIAAAADATGAIFSGIWLDGEPDLLLRRVENRRGDVSDATPDVLRAQLNRDPGEIEWARVSGSGKKEDVLGVIRLKLDEHCWRPDD